MQKEKGIRTAIFLNTEINKLEYYFSEFTK